MKDNEVLRQIRARKSCRAFTDEPVLPEEKAAILEAALQAPTAGNMTMYTILDIQDPGLKQILAERCDHQPFIAKAPLVLLFVADVQKYADLFQAYGLSPAAGGMADLFLAMEDTMIAAQNAVCAAESLGIHSCYIGDIIEHYEENRALFDLPQYALPVCLLVFGRPVTDRKKPPRFALEDVVFENRYPRRNEEELEQMFARRQNLSQQEVQEWLRAFHKRKYAAGFHQEMDRSARAMLDGWDSQAD